MLSYVIPETAKSNGAQERLSLNLNLNRETTSSTAHQLHQHNLDNVLADACDENTHLLIGGTPQSSNRRQQNISNNNSRNFTNNNNNNTGFGGGGGGGVAFEDTQSEEDAVTNSEEISDKQTRLQQTTTKKPPKLSKLGSKTVGLKRVSFGSSKGSMVETLVFETPTPLSEHVEPTFGFESDSTNLHSKPNLDDSGIEIQEDSERSIVRVSIYQSSQPQQICPPEYLTRFEEDLDNTFSNYNFEDIMTTASTIPGYDRQQSTDSGWENPFRPGGDLSREADEIVNMIKGGKPITPTEDHTVGNGNAQKHANGNGSTNIEEVTKRNVAQNQATAQNGTNSHRGQQTTTTTGKPGENNGTVVSKQTVPGPTSASHVTIDEKKNKKKGCCVIQ